MVGRVMGLMMLGCVLGSTTGCRKTERVPATEKSQVVATQTKTETREQPPVMIAAKPEPAPARMAAPSMAPNTAFNMAPSLSAGQGGSGLSMQESTTNTPAGAPTQAPGSQSVDEDDRIWLSESAEAARAGNVNIAPDAETEQITIASGTVDGRVKRVRARTIEVSDGEGNVYELRIDKRSRGLRQGRKVALRNIAEGTRVSASFDLVGGGDSMARDIVLRR